MKYKCGHESTLRVIDSDTLGISAYLNWKDTFGFNGNKSMCWVCYCKMKRVIR